MKQVPLPQKEISVTLLMHGPKLVRLGGAHVYAFLHARVDDQLRWLSSFSALFNGQLVVEWGGACYELLLPPGTFFLFDDEEPADGVRRMMFCDETGELCSVQLVRQSSEGRSASWVKDTILSPAAVRSTNPHNIAEMRELLARALAPNTSAP